MDIMNVLKKSWDNVMHYRSLWIFGIIFALTTFSFPYIMVFGNFADNEVDDRSQEQTFTVVTPSSNHIKVTGNLDFGEVVIDRVVIIYHGQVPDYEPQDGDLLLHWDADKSLAYTIVSSKPDGTLDYHRRTVNPKLISSIAGLLILTGIVIVIVYVLAKVAHYVSATTLIWMVNRERQIRSKLSILQGLRSGWSRAALRVFLIDLVINILLGLVVILLLFLAAVPLMLTIPGDGLQVLVGVFLSSGLFMLVIIAMILGSAVIYMVRVFVHRACVIEDLGVSRALSVGVRTMRSDLMSAGITWLLWFAIQICWPILLLPVVFLLLSMALVISSLPGLLVSGITALFTTGGLPVLLGIIAGMMMFILTLALPLIILNGLREVFISSMWTLTYRAIRRESEQQAMKILETPTLSVAQA
jgi:hypothetical protein